MQQTINHFYEVKVTMNYDLIHINALIKAFCTSLKLLMKILYLYYAL